MATKNTIYKLFHFGESNNLGPFGPSTYTEMEIDMDCTDEDFGAVEAFITDVFCGEDKVVEDFNEKLFFRLVGDNLPDDVDQAALLLIEVSRSYKELPASSTANDITNGIKAYLKMSRDIEEIAAKQRELTNEMYVDFRKLRVESIRLSKEESKRILQEKIEIEEREIRTCSERIEKSRKRLEELQTQLKASSPVNS